MKARQKPGLHRVGQQLGTEAKKNASNARLKSTWFKNDHEDSARSSGVTGTVVEIAPVSSAAPTLSRAAVTPM
jgi:hypothetical protein